MSTEFLAVGWEYLWKIFLISQSIFIIILYFDLCSFDLVIPSQKVNFHILDFSWNKIRIQLKWWKIVLEFDDFTIIVSAYDLFTSIFVPKSGTVQQKSTSTFSGKLSWDSLVKFFPSIHTKWNNFRIILQVSSETSIEAEFRNFSLTYERNVIDSSIQQFRIHGEDSPPQSATLFEIFDFHLSIDFSSQRSPSSIIGISINKAVIVADLTLLNVTRDLALIIASIRSNIDTLQRIQTHSTLESFKEIFLDTPYRLEQETPPMTKTLQQRQIKSSFSFSLQVRSLQISCRYFCAKLNVSVDQPNLHHLNSKMITSIELLFFRRISLSLSQKPNDLQKFCRNIQLLVEYQATTFENHHAISDTPPQISLNYEQIFDLIPISKLTVISTGLSVYVPLEAVSSGFYFLQHLSPILFAPKLRSTKIDSHNVTQIDISVDVRELLLEVALAPDGHNANSFDNSSKFSLRISKINYCRFIQDEFYSTRLSVDALQLCLLQSSRDLQEVIFKIDEGFQLLAVSPRVNTNLHSIDKNVFFSHLERHKGMNFDYWWDWIEQHEQSEESAPVPKLDMKLSFVNFQVSYQSMVALSSLVTTLQCHFEGATIRFESDQPFTAVVCAPLLLSSINFTIDGIKIILSDSEETISGRNARISVITHLSSLHFQRKSVGDVLVLARLDLPVDSTLITFSYADEPSVTLLSIAKSHDSALFSSITRPTSAYVSMSEQSSIVLLSTAFMIQMENIDLRVDTRALTMIGHFQSFWNQQRLRTKNWFEFYFSRSSSPVLRLPRVAFISKYQTEVFHLLQCSINTIHCHLLYDMKSVAIILLSRVQLNHLALIWSCLSQYSGEIYDLSILELSEENSLYPQILMKVPHEPGTPSPHALFQFHLSRNHNYQPILEIVSHHIRLIYLQRAVMTIVSYFRDIIPTLLFPKQPLILVPPLLYPVISTTETSTNDFLQVLKLMLPVPGDIVGDFFRFSWNVFDSEVHLPVNSCANDALVFIFRSLSLSRLSQTHESMTLYSLGPFQRYDLWISDQSSISGLLQGNKDSGWNLRNHFEKLIPPKGVVDCDVETTLSINLSECLICSWCSDNLISKSQDIHCQLTIQSVQPHYSGIYSSVFQVLEYISRSILNCFIVELTSETVDWVISRGQYMTIVYLIQQNFHEYIKVIPPLPVPIPIKISLTKNIHGAWCLNDSYPLFLAVPLDIWRGKIHLIENNEPYYHCLFSAHDKNCRRISERTHGSWIGEVLAYAKSWISFQKTNISEGESNYSVPTWSYHHQYRRLMYSSLGIHSHFQLPLFGNLDDSFNDSFSRPRFDSLGFIFFTNLHFNIVRRHQGGGMSLEALAQEFILTKGSTLVSEESLEKHSFSDTAADHHRVSDLRRDPYDVQFDFESIPSETILLSQMESSSSSNEYSIFYSQNGVGNLRRCVIHLSDVVVVTHHLEITKLINFFVECLTLADTREKQHIFNTISKRYNFRALLDVELLITNFSLCLPADILECVSDTKGLCLEIDTLSYQHSWRGFLEEGPGWIIYSIQTDISSIFISTIWEIFHHRVDIGIDSLMNPLQLHVQSDYTIFPTAANILCHAEVLNKIEKFFPLITPQTVGLFGGSYRYDDTLHFDHRLTIRLQSNPTKSFAETKREIHFQLSLLDISFILKLISTLQITFNNRQKRLSVFENYPVLYSSFQDIAHLPRLYDYLSSVLIQSTLTSFTTEITVHIPRLEALVKNNSYGVKIMLLHFSDPRFSYILTKSGLNAVFSGCFQMDLYNSYSHCFDSVIEHVKCVTICATDITSNPHPSHHLLSQQQKPKLRFDISFEPIEINIPYNTLSSFIRNLSLGDIVTSRSSKLPVYKIVNFLGVPVQCKFYLQITSDLLPTQGTNLHFSITSNIDANHSFSLDTRAYGSPVDGKSLCEMEEEGHCVHISYDIDSITYTATKAYQMDTEGVFEVYLRPVQPKNLAESNYEELARIYSQTSSTNHVKILLEIRVIDSNGTRELTLKSLFSIKNETHCPVSLIAHLNTIATEKCLAPSEVWFLPVTIISQSTNIWMVLQPETQHSADPVDSNQDVGGSLTLQYVCLFRSLYSFLTTNDQFSFGWVDNLTGASAVKLKCHLLTLSHNMSYDNGNKQSTEWTNLILPVPEEVVSLRDKNRKEKFILKFPQDLSEVSRQHENYSPNEVKVVDSPRISIPYLFPCRFHILPPLEIINLFCQPLLYRICGKGNPWNCAEGCLLAGRMIPIHCNPLKSLCLSVRLLNYKWSPWIDIPIFPLNPKSMEETMESLPLQYNSQDIKLPPLTFTIKSMERAITIFCPLWIINRTGKSLGYREGGFGMGNEEESSSFLSDVCFVPARGQHGIENCLVSEESSSANASTSAVKGRSSSSRFRSLGPSTQAFTSIHFTIVSPYDHCKTISIAAFSSMTIKTFISLILEKLFHQDHQSSDHQFTQTHLKADVNHSTYQLYSYETKLTTDNTCSVSRKNPTFLDFQSMIGLNIAQFSLSSSSFALESLLSSIPVDKRQRLILLHQNELQILQQISQFVKKEQRRKSISDILGMKSFWQYTTPFVHYDGDIPFNPKGMILLAPSLSFCVLSETEWSESISLQQNSSTLRNQMDTVRLMKNSHQIYEYSLSFHQGKGVYSDITAVTIIPRIILQSKLPFALQLRQVVLEESSLDVQSMTINEVKESSDEVMLLPYSLQQYHHKLSSPNPLIQLRQYTSSVSNEEHEEEILSMDWSGEINITILGLYHMYLRNPDKILNIRVEAVGVSLVVIFSLQNPKWPPYRIENKTSFLLRCRQSWKKNRKHAKSQTILQPFSTRPYAWDQPFNYCSEKLILYLEFLQIGNHWIPTEFPLNEIDYYQTLKLHRLLPDLTHPICSGDILLTTDRSNNFVKTYAAIAEDTLYLFEDSTLSCFTGMINLGLPLQATDENVERQDFAFFAPYIPKQTTLDHVLAVVGFGGRENQSDLLLKQYDDQHFWDLNSIRRTILRIGSYFELFQVAPASYENVNYMTSMKAALALGSRIDELIAVVSNHPFLVSDLLSAFVILGIAVDETAATFLVKEFYRRNYLQVYPPVIHQNTRVEYEKRVGITQIDLETDHLYFHPPTLCPEFEGNGGPSLPTPPQIYELLTSSKRYLLQFLDDKDMMTWTYSIRICIEKAWISSILSERHSEVTSLSGLDSCETSIHLKMYTDGPIKVLEITEDSTDESLEVTDQVTSVSPYELTVSLHLPSLGISIIDNTPVELLYLFLRDIQLVVDNSPIQRIYIFTIEYIQLDNQLLNPLYPIAFHPRKSRLENGKEGEEKMILLLPGLEHSRRLTLNPTLHCYVQQKLISEGSTLNHLQPSHSSSVTCDLLYFEHLSFWMAPFELSVDEEIVVRTLRIFTKLVSQYLQYSRSLSTDPELQFPSSSSFYLDLKRSGLTAYIEFSRQNLLMPQNTQNIYIRLLEFHPIDVIITVRSTPDFEHYEADDLYFTKMIRVDYGNIQLNALIVKNLFGILPFILSVLSTHYKTSILRQVYALIGATDVMEGSVGLLTNLGSGVYDLFYEPIDGLLGDEHTFMEGLSKGSKSLASKAIGGTSAFTSKIAGGIGLGMAMLTLDSKYQKNREKDRLKAVQSVREGMYVGSKEFGKNVLEGVTGIVVEPYRGWVEDGGVGFGLGLARGLIGVAVKPAVGVFDLASRTTEGIKHSAFNNFLESNSLTTSGRIRFPRQFGLKGEVLPYDWALPSLQIVLDRLTNPVRERKFSVVSYLPMLRCRTPLQEIRDPVPDLVMEDEWNRDPLLERDSDEVVAEPSQPVRESFSHEEINPEVNGYAISQRYIAVICYNSILLLHVGEIHRKPAGQWQKVHLMWKCPCDSIQQFQSHSNGDIILLLKPLPGSANHSVLLSDSIQSPYPTLHDTDLMDYYLFQEILESLFQNLEIARLHPLIPSRDISTCVQLHRKRTGLKSFMKTATKHEYRLYRYILYEFTEFIMVDEMKERRRTKDDGMDSIAAAEEYSYEVDSELGDILHTVNGEEVIFSQKTKIGQFIKDSFFEEEEEEKSIEQVIPDIYDHESEDSSGDEERSLELIDDDGRVMVLTAAIPLIDISVHGPEYESTTYKGEKTYSITLKKKNRQGSSSTTDLPLDFIKRDDMNTLQGLKSNRLKLSSRESVKLLFHDQVLAQNWKIYLSESSLSSSTLAMKSNSTIPSTNALKLVSISSLSQQVTEIGSGMETGAEYRILPNGRKLTIPCGGGNIEEIERFKVTIAQTIFR